MQQDGKIEFDGVPVDDDLHRHEQAEWKQWLKRFSALSQEIATQAVQEMQERDQAPRKRGRPSAQFNLENPSSPTCKMAKQIGGLNRIPRTCKYRLGIRRSDGLLHQLS